jgi:hypothetical protein
MRRNTSSSHRVCRASAAWAPVIDSIHKSRSLCLWKTKQKKREKGKANKRYYERTSTNNNNKERKKKKHEGNKTNSHLSIVQLEYTAAFCYYYYIFYFYVPSRFARLTLYLSRHRSFFNFYLFYLFQLKQTSLQPKTRKRFWLDSLCTSRSQTSEERERE